MQNELETAILMNSRQPGRDTSFIGNIVALHCSLGSGKQWSRLIEACGGGCNAIAPDISGYGGNAPCDHPALSRLDTEVEHLSSGLGMLAGPLHLVGHSFGGAIAFKLATSSRYATRVRSLTLIEPVLPSILLEEAADRPLYDLFALESARICWPLWFGDKDLGLQRFLTFWNGSWSWNDLPEYRKAALNERINKLVGDFSAIFAEKEVGKAAQRLSIPTLLFSGGTSPLPTQQIVRRLASTIRIARHVHLPAAGHMLAITHSSELNPEILRHIAASNARAEVGTPAKPASAGDLSQ